MTLIDLKEYLGIKGIRKISEHTTVVETKNGGAYPAQDIVVKMWELLTGQKL